MSFFQKPQESSSGGITEPQHKLLDTLTHQLAEDAFVQYIYSGGKVTDEIYWTDNTMTLKIRESTFTYVGNKISQEVVKQYDSLGVLVETLTKDYTYSGNTLTSVDEDLT